MSRYEWKSIPINLEHYQKFKAEILADPNYGPSWKSYLETRALMKKIGLEDQSDAAIGSMRTTIIKTHIIKNVGKIQRNISKIASSYNSGTDILELSAKWKFPPLNVLRSIMIHNKRNESDMFKVFTRNTDAAKHLSGRDYDQYIIAAAADGESSFDSELVATIAKYNENQIMSYFISSGIPVVTEGELINKQVEEFGRAIITPDILFKSPIVINGSEIHWLDYKDYMGCPDSYLYDSNVKQAAKYNAAFGQGAIMYHYGHVEMKIQDTLLLDARCIGVKLFG
jgi:hypothetical protein